MDWHIGKGDLTTWQPGHDFITCMQHEYWQNEFMKVLAKAFGKLAYCVVMNTDKALFGWL